MNNHFCTNWGKAFLVHNKTTKPLKNRSRYLNIFRILWHIVEQSSILVTASILNLQYFVWVFSKILILHCVVLPMQLWQVMSNELDILRMNFPSFQKCSYNFFHRTPPKAPTRDLHQRKTLGFCTFLEVWSIRSWVRVTEFVNLKVH